MVKIPNVGAIRPERRSSDGLYQTLMNITGRSDATENIIDIGEVVHRNTPQQYQRKT